MSDDKYDVYFVKDDDGEDSFCVWDTEQDNEVERFWSRVEAQEACDRLNKQ